MKDRRFLAGRRRSRVLAYILGAVILVVLLVGLGKEIESHLEAQAGPIKAGNSKAHCIDIAFAHGVLTESAIAAVTDSTGITYDCLSVFANPMPTWSDWETPWMFRASSDGWDAWLHASPVHQVVMSMDLIPQAVTSTHNPLTWEQLCAAGDYNHYATTLARNLVSYGAGSIVIRLGTEANGDWEADYVGTTSTEMSDWAKCYDNEVSAMRAVQGTRFLFVWNPSACTANLPIDKWYPGNSYVDIIGIDVYDKDCKTLKSVGQEGWKAYSTDSASSGSADPSFPSLANVEAFAAANGKPLSLPEWGLIAGDDDAIYVKEIASTFHSGDFSFESYFDTGGDGIAALGAMIPNATAAYSQAFKSSLPNAAAWGAPLVRTHHRERQVGSERRDRAGVRAGSRLTLACPELETPRWPSGDTPTKPSPQPINKLDIYGHNPTLSGMTIIGRLRPAG